MMGIVVPETCWASNKICNKNHLLHLVGILFPHINFSVYPVFRCSLLSIESFIWLPWPSVYPSVTKQQQLNRLSDFYVFWYRSFYTICRGNTSCVKCGSLTMNYAFRISWPIKARIVSGNLQIEVICNCYFNENRHRNHYFAWRCKEFLVALFTCSARFWLYSVQEIHT